MDQMPGRPTPRLAAHAIYTKDKFMKHNKISQDQNQNLANRNRAESVPSSDEVARRAYFSYVNQGSLPGHDVQHWLDAEAQLIAERNLTRVHGFHNRT
jgi:GH25 family lysozyme M1 (1,4-beta-N-acetylmuramidase)